MSFAENLLVMPDRQKRRQLALGGSTTHDAILLRMAVLRFLITQFRNSPRKGHFFRSLALGSKSGTSTVRSADGTEISVRRTGSGPDLVMIHGALDGMGGWSFVEPPLAENHTVSVYDRRGRGGSGDVQPWSIDREVEDLVAVIDAAAGPVDVVGHSFGAVVAMLACLSGVPMRSLTLYEPPMNGDKIPDDVLNEIRRLVEADDRDAAITVMATSLAGLNEDEVQIALAVPPVRKTLRDGVVSAPREIAALQKIEWVGLPIDGTPTLLLRGECTPTRSYPTPDQFDSIATDIKTVDLPDQRHLAQTFTPTEVVVAIESFLGQLS